MADDKQSSEGFSQDFVDGFAQHCYDRALTLEETETLFRKHANARFLATPNVYAGFSAILQRAGGLGLTKAALARYLTPDVMALAVDCRIKYAADGLSCLMREAMGLPEPSWETVSPALQKTATAISRQLAGFQSLPLQQQLLISALVGSGLGGLKRVLLPNAEDSMAGRGMVNRALRGGLRGGAIGAGAAGGALLGRNVAGRSNAMSGNLAGGALGAVAANQLAKPLTG